MRVFLVINLNKRIKNKFRVWSYIEETQTIKGTEKKGLCLN